MFMNAVVMHGPGDIRVDRKPKPSIQEPHDAIVRVAVAGICGSELHSYRGHQKTTFGHTMGHEFVGFVEDIGSDVTTVRRGDHVFGVFSTSCLRCWFCNNGYTNRCSRSLAIGTAQVDGCQAEYVRVPDAHGTLIIAPTGVDDDLLVMMSDIFPTGYYGAMRALSQFRPAPTATGNVAESTGVSRAVPSTQPIGSAVIVCLGCGIVGLCAVMTAVAKGAGTVLCVDSVEDRLEQARRMGGVTLQLGKDDIKEAVMKATDGRGADAVIESVGNQAALRSAMDLLRPCGTLSSVGFHQGEMPFTALQGYQRNINLNMGRAPVRAVLEEALELFAENKSKFEGLISHRLPLRDAAEGYRLFDTQVARKVVLRP